jgi:hypothetical protein
MKFQSWYFWCYSFSIQSWCWYLSSNSVVSPGVWVRRQLCEPLSALFQAVAHLLPTVSHLLLQALLTDSSHGKHLLAFSSFLWWRGRLCLLKVHEESSSLILPPSPVPQNTSPHPLCVPFSSLFMIPLFFGFIFAWWGSVLKGAMLVYHRDSCRSTVCRSFA